MNEFDNQRRIPLDDQLDAALAKYAAVEPRTGLEERILANLKAQERSSGRVGWWRWAGALAAALLMTVLVLWRAEKHTPQRIVRQPTASQEEISPRAVANPRPAIEAGPVAPVVVRRTPKHRSIQPALVAAEPKLDQFPSPQPLSEEEQALLHYVQSFPKEATLIAKTQEEFELQTQKEMMDAGSQNQPSSSIQ